MTLKPKKQKQITMKTKSYNNKEMRNLNYKTMRKIAFTLLMLLTLSLNAQEIEVTRFLGIPVDGSKSEMISKIKQKGYTYNTQHDCLEGEFNGRDVIVRVVTNKDKVYRVYVCDKKSVSEAEIKIRFNNLVYQFELNRNYHSSDSSQCIKENERISYQMTVNNKYYDACFYQKSDNDIVVPQGLLHNMDSLQYENSHEEVHNAVVEIFEMVGDNKYKEVYLPAIKDMSEQEVFEFDKMTLSMMAYLVESMQWINRKVWFRIYEDYGKYYIGIYYDNVYNAPNGQDL